MERVRTFQRDKTGLGPQLRYSQAADNLISLHLSHLMLNRAIITPISQGYREDGKEPVSSALSISEPQTAALPFQELQWALWRYCMLLLSPPSQGGGWLPKLYLREREGSREESPGFKEDITQIRSASVSKTFPRSREI